MVSTAVSNEDIETSGPVGSQEANVEGNDAASEAGAHPSANVENEEVHGVHRPKSMRVPHMPTEAEVREHETTHIPYRSWCPSCIAGRGRDRRHKKKRRGRKRVATIHIDFW